MLCNVPRLGKRELGGEVGRFSPAGQNLEKRAWRRNGHLYQYTDIKAIRPYCYSLDVAECSDSESSLKAFQYLGLAQEAMVNRRKYGVWMAVRCTGKNQVSEKKYK